MITRIFIAVLLICGSAQAEVSELDFALWENRITEKCMWLLIAISLFSQDIESKVKTEFLITEVQVGRFKLGMPIDSLVYIYPDEYQSLKPAHLWTQRTLNEIYYTPMIEVYEHNKRIFTIFVDCWRRKTQGCDYIMRSVRVWDERYKTVHGIGVGSTFGELKRYYKVKHSRVERIDESPQGPVNLRIRIFVGKTRISFYLNLGPDDLDVPDNYWTGDISVIPDSARVMMIHPW